MALKMSDKLQFVASFCHSPTAESLDKLKFVGHFWIRQRYHKSPHSKDSVNSRTAIILHNIDAIEVEFA